MSARSLIIPMLIVVASWILPEATHAQPNAGVVLWRHTTSLEAKSATDFDGSDDTADARSREWDTQGSGFGLRGDYHFPRLTSVYLQIGLAQTTVRDEDLADPNLDLSSLGFDDGFSAGIGARVGDDFPGNKDAFWSVGVAFSFFSSDMNEDINTTWDYNERTVMLDGTAGYTIEGVGLYGGLRLVRIDAELEENDRTNLPSQQVRRTELERDNPLDLLIGARTGSAPVAGFVELGVVGSFSATVGFAFGF